jgi:hypothetical protein
LRRVGRPPYFGEHDLNAHSATPLDRRDERTHLFLVATLSTGQTSVAVRVRNLSPTGALVEAQGLPPAGSEVVLRRGALEARGKVAWAGAGRAGMSLAAPVAVSAWLPTRESARQSVVDQVAFGVKRGGPSSAVSATADPHALSPEAAIADLVRLRAELDRLGDLLAQDAAVVAAHPDIQLFDIAVQRIARIIEALRPTV